MGLPQQQFTNEAASQPEQAKDVSTLPPEAIALATKLFDFARQGKTPELQQYISAGIPINLTNDKGDTLLMLASYHGHTEAVNMLLQKGADANVLNARGQSPIAGAVFKGHDDVVRALYAKGADIRAGQPNAIDSAEMFEKEDYLRLFDPGREREAA